MNIHFLGTGTSQGVPVITCRCPVCLSEDKKDKRLRSSVLIQIENQNIVIDAGPDFRYQMLRSGIMHLDAILLTHEHKDHLGGLDDIRAFNHTQKKPTEIYAEQRVLKAIKEHEFAYVFADKKYPGIPQMNLNPIENKPFTIGKTTIIPIRGIHHTLKVFGFRIGNFAYLTDMNQLPSEERKKLLNLDTLVITALRIAPHISHFCLAESLEIIAELKPRRAFLTHMSHNIGFHEIISEELPAGVLPAYDGLSIEIEN